jgi:BNR/Asp-box repeat
MARLALVLASLAVWQGWAVADASAAGTGCHSGWPVVAHHAGGEPAEAAKLPLACATETGYATSESTLAITKSGAILYSPAHTENSLARSLDGGASWSLTYPKRMQYTSIWNTVDPFITVDRRTGRAFWVRATGDLRTTPILVDESPLPYQAPTAIAYAHGFQVYSSSDDGLNWTTADYQHENLGDWEKVFVGPPSSAPGALQPVDYPGVVYVCGNAPFEVSGPGRDCYRSLDGGATFNLAGYVFPSDTSPADACAALAGNVGVVGNDGTVYEPQTCRNGAYLAVSHDEGTSYSWLTVAGAPGTAALGGGYQLAIDHADNLYAMWLAEDQINVAISRDHGQTWSAPLSVTAPGLHNIALPALAAGPEGHLAITYYGTTDASSKSLTAYITETKDALASKPLFYSGAINDPAHPIFTDYGFDGTPRADFVGGSYDPSGTFWAGVVKQLGPPGSDGDVPTTGYVGRLEFESAPSPTPTPAPRCVDRRKFAFRIHQPRHGRVVAATAFVDGKRVKHVRGRRITRIVLRRLPRGTFTVRIVAVTNRHTRTVSVRRYRGCTKGRPHTHVEHAGA